MPPLRASASKGMPAKRWVHEEDDASNRELPKSEGAHHCKPNAQATTRLLIKTPRHPAPKSGNKQTSQNCCFGVDIRGRTPNGIEDNPNESKTNPQTPSGQENL